MICHDRDEGPQPLKAPDVPVISHPDIPRGWLYRQIELAKTHYLTSDYLGQDGDADALAAHPPLYVAIVRPEERLRVRKALGEPGNIRELAGRRVVGDEPEAGSIAMDRLG